MDQRFNSGNSDSPCRYPSTRIRPQVAVEKSLIRNGRHHSSGNKTEKGREKGKGKGDGEGNEEGGGKAGWRMGREKRKRGREKEG